MTDVKMKMSLDGASIRSELTEQLNGYKKVADAQKQLTEEIQERAEAAVDAEKKVATAIVESNKKLDDYRQRFVAMKKAYEEHGKSAGIAFKTDAIRNYNNALKDSNDLLKQLTSNSAKNILNPQEIKQLSDALKNTKNDFQALSVILDVTKKKLSGLDTASAEYVELNNAIKAAEVMLTAFDEETGAVEASQVNLKKRLREITMELAALKAAGETNTAQYRALREEAGELMDTLGDVREEIAQAGSDTAGFDHLIRTATLVTSGFQIAQGTMALFGSESEDLQKTLLRVNAAMSILNGLQAIQTELARADSLVRAIQTAAQNTYTWAVNASTASLKAFRVALIATGVGAFVVALGFLIEAMMTMGEETEDETTKQKKLNEELERTKQLLTAVATAAENERNARAGRLNDSKRELELAEARGDSEEKIAALKSRVANEELRNLRVLRETFTDDAEKRLEYDEKIKDKLNEIKALGLANEKALRDERKKNHDQQLKDLEDLAKFIRGEATVRVAAIKDNNERELAEIRLGRDNELQTVNEAYNKLMKIKGFSDAQRLQLTESYHKQVELINTKYANKEVEAITKQNQELVDIQTRANMALLHIRGEAKDLELAQIDQDYNEITDALKKAGRLTAEVEGEIVKARNKAKTDLNGEYAIRELDQREELAKSSVDLLRVQGGDEVALTRTREILKTKIAAEYAQQRLNMALKQQGLNADIDKEDIERYQKYLAEAAKAGTAPVDFLSFLNIDTSGLTPEEQSTLKKLGIDVVKTAQDGIDAGIKELDNRNIFTQLFGFSEDEAGILSNSYDIARDLMSAFTDSMEEEIERQIEIIDERIKKYDDQIEDIEGIIKREEDLQKAGAANSVETERKRLAEVQALRAAELEDRKAKEAELQKVREQEAKARAIEIVALAAFDAAKMISAAAQIMSGHTAIDPIFGYIHGAAAIATMLAAMAKARAEIRKAQAEVPTFKEGGGFDLYSALDGQPSHDQGGVALMAGNRKLAEFEGDEKLFTINKGSSKKYARLLDAVNKDQLSTMTFADLMAMVSPTGIKFNQSAPRQIVIENQQANAPASGSSKSDTLLKQIAENTSPIANIAESNESMRSQGMVVGDEIRIKTSDGERRIRYTEKNKRNK